MTWLLKLLAPIKSELFAMVGVLAVCGIGATAIGYLHIQRQNGQLEAKEAQIGSLVKANQEWAERAAEVNRLRAVEQRNTLLLQDKLELIEGQGTENSAQIQTLRNENAEMRELMSRRLTPDMQRLLEQQR